ncbi:MAG TPA: MFS transporter [Ilumatobacteraceae bacterium]|nr:MFS transporter [Ilumatobacteraceae bacterium]
MTNHPFVPLRHRAVRLLWSAAVVSDIGTWVQLIVVGSLVAAKTGSAVQTGLVALATFAPQSIASPVGGLLADRFDRRKVFAAALMVQALVTTALAVTLGVGIREPAVLILLILLASAAGATGAPSYAAMLPDLVPPEELMAMVSLGVYSWNSGRIIGPLLGTALVLVVGPAWTIGFNAASFVVLALAVAMVRRTFRPTRSDGTIFDRLVGGWRTLRSTPGCFHGVALLVLYNLTIVPFIGLIPIYLRAGYGGGTGMAGTVASAQGAGAIIGGIIVSVLAHRHPRSLLIGRLIVLLAFALGLYAVAPNAIWVVAASALLGGAGAGFFIASSAIIQRDAPPASRGRVMSIMQAAMGISYGVGLLFIGSIGDATNLHLAFGVGAILMLVGFGLLTLRSRHWRTAVDGGRRPAVVMA